MDQSFWAGVATVETASQLAFGYLLIAGHFASAQIKTRERPWLASGIACIASAVSTATLYGLLIGDPGTVDGTRFHALSAGFASAIVLYVVAMVRAPLIAIPGMRDALVRRFSLALVALVALVFAFVSPIQKVMIPGDVSYRFAFTAEGRALLAALVAMLLSVMALLRRAKGFEPIERAGYFVSLSSVVAMLVVDCLGYSDWFGPVPLTMYAGIPWCFSLFAMTLAVKVRLISRYHAVVSELESSKLELSLGNAQIEQMQRELGTKKQLAAVGELAAAIAHEVRNPLAIIVNAAAGLRRPTLQVEDRNTLLGILDEETARLNRLVTDLLRFARPVIIKRSTVSIPELAKRVEGRLDDKQILLVDIPEDSSLRVVQADANLLRLVFDNLVSNAFQAMPEGGTVRIVVSKDDNVDSPFVKIDIIDQGQGMDEQVKARAIDPFYTTRPSGTGLGLPIVQRIVEAHGGRISIESAPNQGTTVSLLLPNTTPGEVEEREREEITLR
jgi:signal transduction histidine kinase